MIEGGNQLQGAARHVTRPCLSSDRQTRRGGRRGGWFRHNLAIDLNKTAPYCVAGAGARRHKAMLDQKLVQTLFHKARVRYLVRRTTRHRVSPEMT
jgi:hypothetical protein